MNLRNIFFIVIFIFLTGCCLKKNVLSQDDLELYSSKNQYFFEEISDEDIDQDFVNEAYILYHNGWQIEFYFLKDSETAKNLYLINKKNIEDYFTSTSSEDKEYGLNYKRYSLITPKRYYYVTYVNNTLMYVDVDVVHYKKVNGIIKQLGY